MNYHKNITHFFLDAMAMVKLNVFHWHMTDSQSFPLVLKSHPDLSKIGAYSPEKIYNIKDIIGVCCVQLCNFFFLNSISMLFIFFRSIVPSKFRFMNMRMFEAYCCYLNLMHRLMLAKDGKIKM